MEAFRVRSDVYDDFISRFERELCVLRDLEHPNILAPYDWGYDHGYFYRVMELCTADNLAQLQQGPLPVTENGWILRELASALNAVHSNQVFHCDNKTQ